MRSRAVVVVHRHAMVAEGVGAAIAQYPGIVTVGSTTDLAEGEKIGRRSDAVVLDQFMVGALGAASRLRRAGVRVVLLGDGAEEHQDLRVPIRASIGALASALVPGVVAAGTPQSLSPRQREILRLIANGMVAKQVAYQLGISEKTVEQHKARIFAKLQVPNQAAAVRVAMAQGIGGSGL
ncbi:MAG TPA: response regulator transcription factor [Actinomycetota bacterium]|nr:response regulator transcription factor [Actinomycetota bacterium]